ncbi:MAG: rhamnulokinase [Chloroflexi bacterium]|nr:MAG: rhamnulokinase [Chloroflexota bacterium]
MSAAQHYLAIDLGAESGRAILGRIDAGRLALQEVHRFANGPVRLPDGLHWDVLRLWQEIKTGIGKAAATAGALDGIGVDAWGVDFALLDARGALLFNPYHYRDSRTDRMLETAFRRLNREQIFEHTGIQFMQINSLYQLLAMVENEAPVLDAAKTFLTIPDLFNYWLTGRAVCEFTNATTTQCFDPRRHAWALPVLNALHIPTHIFPEVIPAGTELGPMLPALANELGLPALRVIAPACHDTGSAVVAVPAEDSDFAWISSGAWSVLGAVVPEAVITARSLAYNFTNEGGVNGTFRLCKNIMGLWLVQECRRTWAAQGESLSYQQLTQMAAAARPFACVIDPDDSDFLKPGDMPARLRGYAARTGQEMPQSKGEVIRCALEGIALKYRFQLERLEELLGRELKMIHIVGGGVQNRLLSQFTADATGRPVLAGPVEATATGNILMQALACGHMSSLAEARALLRQSIQLEVFEPRDRQPWDEAYAALRRLLSPSHKS